LLCNQVAYGRLLRKVGKQGFSMKIRFNAKLIAKCRKVLNIPTPIIFLAGIAWAYFSLGDLVRITTYVLGREEYRAATLIVDRPELIYIENAEASRRDLFLIGTIAGRRSQVDTEAIGYDQPVSIQVFGYDLFRSESEVLAELAVLYPRGSQLPVLTSSRELSFFTQFPCVTLSREFFEKAGFHSIALQSFQAFWLIILSCLLFLVKSCHFRKLAASCQKTQKARVLSNKSSEPQDR